ncbi:MAG: hypothetical protein AAGM67_13180 [Bacteroidota bacterium]
MQNLLEYFKKKSVEKWERLKTYATPPSQEQAIKEAYEEGLKQGFWNGVTDGYQIALEEDVSKDPKPTYEA